MGAIDDGWRTDVDADLRALERRIAVLREQAIGLDPETLRARIDDLVEDLRRAGPPEGLTGAGGGRDQSAIPDRSASDRPAPTVLIVDDDDDVRRVLAMHLGIAGMIVLEADGGEQALALAIGDDAIDVVVCDVHLPGTSGIDVLTALHALPGRADLPVVLLTSDRSAETVAEGLAAGAADYIRKPVVQRELQARLRRVLDEAGSRQAVAETLGELEVLAETDALTGLPNRRALEATLRDRIGRTDTALLLLDVDGFKQVNDADGHLEGDRVLQAIAQVLRRSKRNGDVVGRWGGDEFALIASDIDADGLGSLAHRILTTVRDIRSANGVQTVSIGGARAGELDGEVATLVASADKALYRAKGLGRNRFELLD